MPRVADWYLVAAVPGAFVVCGLVGVALERLVIRHLYGRPLESLLATWGISLILIQTVRSVFGAQNVAVANPRWLSGGYELVSGLVVPWSRVAVVLFVTLVVLAVWMLLRYTRLGLQLRAVTENREMAAAMGVATARVDTYTFALGCGVAGLGGVALSQLGNVGPELGQQYVIDSFMVVVLGGVGKLAGTVVAAVGLGVLNKLLEPLVGAVLGRSRCLGSSSCSCSAVPQGLFSLKGRTGEGRPPFGAWAIVGGGPSQPFWSSRFFQCSSIGRFRRVAVYAFRRTSSHCSASSRAMGSSPWPLTWCGASGHPQSGSRGILCVGRVRDGHDAHARDVRRGRVPQ